MNTIEIPNNVVIHTSNVGATIIDDVSSQQWDVFIDEVTCETEQKTDHVIENTVNVNIGDGKDEDVIDDVSEPVEIDTRHNNVDYVGICLVNDEGKILISKRVVNDDKPFSGFYQIVGGKIEDNEDSVIAAIRETREEVGVDISSTLQLLFEYTAEDESGDAGSGTVYVYKAFANTFINMEPEKIDGDWFWSDPSSWSGLYPLTPAMKKIMDNGYFRDESALVDPQPPETDNSSE